MSKPLTLVESFQQLRKIFEEEPAQDTSVTDEKPSTIKWSVSVDSDPGGYIYPIMKQLAPKFGIKETSNGYWETSVTNTNCAKISKNMISWIQRCEYAASQGRTDDGSSRPMNSHINFGNHSEDEEDYEVTVNGIPMSNFQMFLHGVGSDGKKYSGWGISLDSVRALADGDDPLSYSEEDED